MRYRTEIPTEAVCSPDGSLLAVAHGGHVVVYELGTNVLRVVLTCPEVRKVLHVTFVGKSGRCVAVADNRIVILWDLVASNGGFHFLVTMINLISSVVRWQYVFSRSIRHVISHPQDDAFVVMYANEHSPSTALRKFKVASANPISFRTLPFKLRKVVWYPYLALGNNFTLIGITEKWCSVLLGDRVSLPQEEGSSAREILGDVNLHQRNLFQDIFGVSAFHNTPSQPPLPSSIGGDMATGMLRSNNPLDAPAHLLPPLHTLFSPLVESLLRKRDMESHSESKEEERQVEEENSITEDAPSLRTSACRVLLAEEMDEFVELFKQQTFCEF